MVADVRRRWFQFSLRAMLAAFGAVLVLVAVLLWVLRYTSDPVIPDPWKRIASVRVSIGEDPQSSDLVLTITDPKQIKALIVDPLHKSRRDPRPAKYEVLGYVIIYYDDGSEDWLLMFLPWGYCEHEGRYLIADFSALRDELERLNETVPMSRVRASLFRHN